MVAQMLIFLKHTKCKCFLWNTHWPSLLPAVSPWNYASWHQVESFPLASDPSPYTCKNKWTNFWRRDIAPEVRRCLGEAVLWWLLQSLLCVCSWSLQTCSRGLSAWGGHFTLFLVLLLWLWHQYQDRAPFNNSSVCLTAFSLYISYFHRF